MFQRLNYLQENQIRPLLQFKAQIDIHFFVEEAADPIGDMNYFCTHYIENLSISLTKFSFGLLSELELSLFQFKFLKFYRLATGKVYTLSEAIEKTSYARSTFNFRIDRPQLPLKLFFGFLSAVMSFVFLPKIEKVIHLINRIRASLRVAHHTLKTMRTRVYWSTRSSLIQQSLTSYWSTRSLLTDSVGLVKSISSKLFWLFMRPPLKLFWSLGYVKGFSVRLYWAMVRFSKSCFWYLNSLRFLYIKIYWQVRFVFNYLLWPFRKAYWIFEFQYEKRFIKNTDFSIDKSGSRKTN